MGILRKEYCTRRGRALEAFRTRAKSRGRPVTSDRPPPRRFGQSAWAASGRPIFATGGGHNTLARNAPIVWIIRGCGFDVPRGMSGGISALRMCAGIQGGLQGGCHAEDLNRCFFHAGLLASEHPILSHFWKVLASPPGLNGTSI
jgi:hypothetical protein